MKNDDAQTCGDCRAGSVSRRLPTCGGDVDWGITPGGIGGLGINIALLATGTAFGLLLLCAWLAGRISKQIGLPMVTGFLLIGDRARSQRVGCDSDGAAAVIYC